MEEEVITTSFVKRLVKEIEELKKINEQHRKTNGELRDTINKAKEYITSQKLHKFQDTTGGLTYQEIKLLEILDKGE